MVGGFTQISNFVIRSNILTAREKAIYCLIASFNPSFPSIGYIRDAVGCTRSTIASAVKKMHELGIIHVKRKYGCAHVYSIIEPENWPILTMNQFLTSMKDDQDPTEISPGPSIESVGGRLKYDQVPDRNKPTNNTNNNTKLISDDPIFLNLRKPSNRGMIIGDIAGDPVVDPYFRHIAVEVQQEWFKRYPNGTWIQERAREVRQKLKGVSELKMVEILDMHFKTSRAPLE